MIVAATGVSNGDLLRGVRFLADSARTHSLLMCTRCNWVRFVDGIHFFARERREEVRLLGFGVPAESRRVASLPFRGGLPLSAGTTGGGGPHWADPRGGSGFDGPELGPGRPSGGGAFCPLPPL